MDLVVKLAQLVKAEFFVEKCTRCTHIMSACSLRALRAHLSEHRTYHDRQGVVAQPQRSRT